MLCPNCGQDNRPLARFCSQCRTALGIADAGLAPGQTMKGGQYRILRQLGSGGMGAVYLAANTQAFDRPCVIKEMLAYYEPGKEQEAKQRFEDEAKILASLKHAGVPDIYGYFSEGDHNYIVMEYLEGDNLSVGLTTEDEQGHTVPGKPFPVREVLRYGIEICHVLEYLASIAPEPFVHNDIKPANIIIDRSRGHVVLVDFGTAGARYALKTDGQVGVKKSDVYGTVGYAAPEQFQRRNEPKSDVYGLAATLYHLLTDDDPRAHPFKFPKLSELPADLRAVLEKALVANVTQRLDAREFRLQLEALVAPKRNWTVWVAAGALLLGAGVIWGPGLIAPPTPQVVEKIVKETVVVEKPAETVAATVVIVVTPTGAEKAISTASSTIAPSASPTPPDAVVNYVSVNLRAGPGDSYAIAKSYSQGVALSVLGQAPGGEWLKVRAPDGAAGWMYAPYLQVNLKSIPLAEAPPTPTVQGSQKEIVLSGNLESLKRGEQFLWAAIAVECFDANGKSLGRVGLDREAGSYLLPSDIARVKLWIGEELGGAGWWSRWDSQPVEASRARITVSIRALSTQPSAPGVPATPTQPAYPW